jgi:hypothetical protein
MALGDKTIHPAVPVEPKKSGEWVEGRRQVAEDEGPPFHVLLQLPTGGTEDSTVPRGRRVIKQPQILYEPFADDGSEVELKAADELLVTAPELTGPNPVRWQVDGAPTPLAKPGFLIGWLARLKRVED